MPAVTACATLGYAALPVRDALERIAASGFDRVEITELGAYCRHLPRGQADPSLLAGMLEELRLRPVAMNVSTSRLENGKLVRLVLSDPRHAEEALASARWFLRAARTLSCPLICFPIGPRVLDEAEWKREIESACGVYRRIVEEGADQGVLVNLEVPHLFQLTDSVDHALRIFDKVDHPALGATVDASHWGIIGYELGGFFRALGGRLRHVHLRDSAGPDTRDFGQRLELTPGSGTVDFAAFGSALDAAQYRGEVTLELEHRHGDASAIDREHRKALRHLRNCGFTLCGGVLAAASRPGDGAPQPGAGAGAPGAPPRIPSSAA